MKPGNKIPSAGHPVEWLGEEALELIARRFRMLGESSRLKLLIALKAGERNVTELVRETGLRQANVSRHLQTLANAGILTRSRRGSIVTYGIADHSIFEMCDSVCSGIRRHLNLNSEVMESQAGQENAGTGPVTSG